MVELPLEYWNKLSSQFILISVFLGGFSIAITANLLINQTEKRLYNVILKLATTSSSGFLTTVFSMTNIVLATADGSPISITQSELNTPRVIGFLGYLVGVLSLLTILGLSGWTKSKATGIFTTVVSAITFILFVVTAIF
ncbi:hypothetical protein [Fulvivirga lutimaris]|uniref:hypothetical protein n=1 Tax=Fulvivirga lutimaris TaxID=1819566 RepID=UPI0012BD35BD|nr:hypothetical protein [Fulvivirga lutimaris]MTI39205.1 hypothetical protein [Fulvivirga lutimaris]